ncbi:hypothetical protein ACP4OV_012924 [Aristida adscensionis]
MQNSDSPEELQGVPAQSQIAAEENAALQAIMSMEDDGFIELCDYNHQPKLNLQH